VFGRLRRSEHRVPLKKKKGPPAASPTPSIQPPVDERTSLWSFSMIVFHSIRNNLSCGNLTKRARSSSHVGRSLWTRGNRRRNNGSETGRPRTCHLPVSTIPTLFDFSFDTCARLHTARDYVCAVWYETKIFTTGKKNRTRSPYPSVSGSGDLRARSLTYLPVLWWDRKSRVKRRRWLSSVIVGGADVPLRLVP